MRKDRLYFFTFSSIAIIYIIIASISFNYLVKESMLKLLDTHLEFSKKEAKTLSLIVGQQLKSGTTKDTIIKHVQESLKGTDLNMGFLSIYDWSGKIIIHPDIKNVGLSASKDNAYVSSVRDDLNSETFYDLIHDDLNNIEYSSRVISLHPITSSDWILAAHVKSDSIIAQLNNYKRRFFTIFLIMGLLLVVSSVLILRYLGSIYEKRLELKNEKLEDEVINLSKLNRDVIDYQEKVVVKEPTNEVDSNLTKMRILTYIRNELVPIPIEDIAYIYTEHTITYVICNDGKQTTTNVSLDELFSQLDTSYFFRANRQFIIAISSISKIVKYGNNQLKIIVKPNSEANIIISKNRAAQFKHWLNT